MLLRHGRLWRRAYCGLVTIQGRDDCSDLKSTALANSDTSAMMTAITGGSCTSKVTQVDKCSRETEQTCMNPDGSSTHTLGVMTFVAKDRAEGVMTVQLYRSGTIVRICTADVAMQRP